MDKSILLCSFNEIEARLNEGYKVISVTGKVYGNYLKKEEVIRIRGLSTYRNYYHERARDFLACFVLFSKELERLGYERIRNSILEASGESNKIAICDKNEETDFCYRYIFANFLLQNGYNSVVINDAVMNKQKELWSYDVYKARGHHKIALETIKASFETANWHFAKTMPKNPHSYTLRKEFGNDGLFLSIVKHIRNFGAIQIFEKQIYRTLTIDNYQYWTMACDLEDEDCDLINKCEIK